MIADQNERVAGKTWDEADTRISEFNIGPVAPKQTSYASCSNQLWLVLNSQTKSTVRICMKAE
jgi:hypothetical protein